MSTFFSRRYMRRLEEVGRTEKVLGVLLLLLSLAVVAAFVTYSATNREFLFEVDEAAQRGEEEPYEVSVARKMLPALDGAGWQAGEVEAFDAEALPSALGREAADLIEHGVAAVYRRRYRNRQAPAVELAVMICDMAGPARALGLLRARRPDGAEAMNVGRDGWRVPGRAGFWKGRYYTELRVSLGTAVTALTLESAAGEIAAVQLDYGESSQEEGTPPPPPLPPGDSTGQFPAPGVSGWRAPREVSRFTPDTLYQKINGRAGLYLQFHMVGLLFGSYYHERDAERVIDVFWYDMGEGANALGIYRAEAPEHAASAAIGEQSYQTGGAVFFMKGSSYVQVLPAGPDKTDGQVALEIAKAIGDAIQGSGGDMWALEVLPQEGRIADSFEYLADDAFGLDFLRSVFTADYNTDGGRITLFIHRAENEAAAKALFQQYKESFSLYGQTVWTVPDDSRMIAAGEVSGVIDVVFAKGRYVGGVTGAEDLTTAKDTATSFYEHLTAP